MQIDHLAEYIDLDELSGEKFSIDVSVNSAKEILENLKEEDEIFDGEFDDDIWIFERHLYKGGKISFDFSKLKNTARFRDDWDISSVLIVKCWVAELLSEIYPETVRAKFGLLINIIEQTNFFSTPKLDNFIESLRYFSPAVKKVLEEKEVMDLEDLKEELKRDRQGIAIVYQNINVALNFLTFSESDSFHTYHKPLIDIKKGLPNIVFPRQLPKGKDVLKMDSCISQYFVGGFNSTSRLFFAPILLWWKITNIIPMRISEFCTIKRECISQNNGRYYIMLPREKKPAAKRRVQVVDTLEITEDIFELIDDYIQLTNPYGESKTLISYRSILEVNHTAGRGNKVDMNYFNRHNFESLLKRFYKDVVYGEYKKSVEREVRPNDTRHFAFCSLLMQGISPIEIARLGGHSSLEAQYHYSNHTEYFIDVEIKKLIDGFKFIDGKIRGTTFEGKEITFEDIEDRSLQFPSKDNKTRYPMEIGFCTDELQRCESEECILCKHWWIHPKDLEELKPLVEEKILERKQKIIEMGNFLKNLNESFTTEMIKQNEVYPNTFTKMKTEAASIQEHLVEIARLEILKGDNDDE
ncbi:site-specific integrase [Peribacillus frigoritolerans]|uniref:site-specific integrase n=1 Tax=Peribacillus frigoritolerans TaxID=450367 RepID=UPI002225F889|nr:site-specific integrase [Peribacillus frigoritolerans]UYY98658.1 site-specific integrase [Peribacillus frigoritolerans]